ncbi:substrate-binding domain-containing protein [Sulfitobacter sp. G21635-S1]|uniref:sugar ABC transporter substrate-binding protein n=1 Tax=Sulfitobacter sp. G21635-S1 TaxID=3014043 RepID=UPI0022AE6AF5|nr:substrate-binding domain-containing protein [Sulfitobacter sp. G21635-S1]MCZ4257009.1 substrate-binding domain-containing protein [Sulfitobacter sp. G21635-S1]
MKKQAKTILARGSAVAAALLMTASAVAAETKTLGVSMPILAGPWYTAILYGIETKAKELGYDIVVLDAGGYSNIDRQLSQVQNLITQQVDAILVDPGNPSAFNGVAREARGAGVPLIGVSSPIVASDVPPDGAVSSSHCTLGEMMAEGAETILPEGGTIGVLAGPGGAFWAEERLRCFKENVTESGIEIVAAQSTDQDVAIAMTTANDIIQRFPDVTMLYAADDTYGIGAARAVQQAGKCGEIKVLFAVLGEAAQDLMEQGCVDYVVAQKPVTIGSQAVDLADKLISGSAERGEVRTISPVAVYPDNLAEIDLTEIRQPSGWRPAN